MTAAVVSPVIPRASSAGAREGGSSGRAALRRPLPMPPLAPLGDRSMVYGTAAMDCNGRVTDATVFGALGWAPGTRLSIREHGGLLLVTADRRGVFGTTGQGHLTLPATVRHWCGLVAGDRVLLAADPARGLLVVHPPAAVDAMIAQFHAGVLGGVAG